MFLKKNRIYKIFTLLLVAGQLASLNGQTVVPNSQIFADDQAADQDDMCIWIHPDPEKSTVITSDKSARKLFVYNLDGSTVQVITYSEKPRNIDVRYNFSLSGENVDIVGVGLGDQKIYLYTVDKVTRKLIPAGSYDSDMSSLYGFCLYKNMTNNKYYAFASTNSGSGQIRQWELIDNGDGTIGGIHKRTWENGNGGLTEGLVADDETRKFYAASEDDAIYKYDADPVSPDPVGEKIVSVGENGLAADIEGIALYFAADGEGYLIASSQGNSTFKVYDRKPPHSFIKTFEVNSVSGTDGLDVTNINMGSLYPKGLLVVHDGKRVYGAKYEDIGLSVDTEYWNPRTADEPDLDFIAPSPVADFLVTLYNQDGTSVTASWDSASSGDDSTSGSISSFEIRWANEEAGIINTNEKWLAATGAFQGNQTDFANGLALVDMSTFVIGDKYFAIRTKDEAGNISDLKTGSFSDIVRIPDAIAPASVSGFTVSADNPDFDSATAFWDKTSSGDDSTSGNISSFEIRWTEDGKITTNEKWLNATIAFQGDSNSFANGSVQIDMSGTDNNPKYFAIRTKDDADNTSPLETGSYSDIVTIPDIVEPASVTGFMVALNNPDGSSVTASWDSASSGDDSTSGSISSFEIRWANKEAGIINTDEKWLAAVVAYQGGSSIFLDGSIQIDMSGFSNGDKYFAIRTKDEADNISALEEGSFSDIIIVSGIETTTLPSAFLLSQNYPNPFGENSSYAKNPVTTIQYKLNQPDQVLLEIYNTLGQKIRTLVNSKHVNGDYSVKFDASGLPGGIYIYQIKTGSKILTKKMLLLR